MKAYPITEDELDRIADLGLYSTICFSVAGACFGLAINFQKDQMLNAVMAPGVGETWEILKWLSVGVAVLACFLGVVLTRRRRGQVHRIKQESSFA